MGKFKEHLKNPEFRKWLYGIYIAILVLLAGNGVITSVQQDNLAGLGAAIVNMSVTSGFALAIRKATPAATDEDKTVTEVAEVLPPSPTDAFDLPDVDRIAKHADI